jgi:hypothetical protein
MAMSHRDPQRERFWRATLQDWSVSHQSIRDFCRARDLAETAFHYWRKELRRRDSEVKERVSDPKPAFVAVTVAPDSSPAPAIEVRCPSGHVVAMTGCDESILRSLFAALRPEASC